MKAGWLKHRITLQSPGGVRDDAMERDTQWTDVATVWASVEPLSGREEWVAAQRQASTTHQVMFRVASQYAALDASWRVLYRDRVFTIDEPPRNTLEEGREIVLSCTEGKRLE